ncbi:hypothetical protein K7X08_000375 [Anisodus acutangulus]|uniref:Uncharacterized protein n=1 Tax=Anisodus acutangulus TaxID=402998 RepID=A0A9Q1RE20_9SOLA|nr:hypothetical protein K7X08_000375 [Anisodus acutangulus]
MISSLGAASSSSASLRVEKATSEFLIGPDWTMNIDICDTISSNQWLAKGVVKAVKKRLQHKNPKVQLLALTLLETMVKNCGDNVHFQIAERSILQDMVKIVKKRTDMHVRDKVLVLLDSWQDAFGGAGGKYPQYYWACEELRRAGVEFPKRSFDTAPTFTPVTHPAPRQPQSGYGMPSNSSTRLDEAMAAEVGNLSLSSINSMRDVTDLLADMLQAVTPGNRLAVKDEVIVDLVDRCRSNQKKLMQMLTTTGDEELLAQGLELNDNLQTVLAKHDAIASRSPLPTQVPNDNLSAREMHDPSIKPAEVNPPSPTADAKPSAPVLAATAGQVHEEEDEEDDFSKLARRHSKTSPAAQTSEGMVSGNSTGEPLDLVASNALILCDPPATSKEQDIIDLLSLTLSSTSVYPETPQSSASATQNTHQESLASSIAQGNPYASQAYLGYQDQSFNSYVAPWAQPQSQPQPQHQLPPQFHPQYQHQGQPQFHPQFQHPTQAQFQPQPQHHPQQQPQSQLHHQPSTQPQPQQPQESLLQSQHTSQQLPQSPLQPEQPRTQLELHPESQPRAQTQFPQYSAYPPPLWAATPGYLTNPSPSSRPSYMYSTPQATTNRSVRPVQNVNSFPTMGSNGLAINGDTQVRPNPKTIATPAAGGQKTFTPSYRLFEDLNVFGNGDQRHNSSGLSGTNSQSMVGGRK